MTDSGWEAIARRARQVEAAVSRVRETAEVGDVWVEVRADGRLTELRLPDPALAQRITTAYARAAQQVSQRIATLCAELADDPALTTLRDLIDRPPATPNRPCPPQRETAPAPLNPYALPETLCRRYGFH